MFNSAIGALQAASYPKPYYCRQCDRVFKFEYLSTLNILSYHWPELKIKDVPVQGDVELPRKDGVPTYCPCCGGFYCVEHHSP